jgi:putative redox protein
MQDRRIKLTFNNQDTTLSGLLETPTHSVKAYVLFSHCFTCGKDIAAAARIARALVAKGYAVLRFDFTGLGASEGDFSDTNFSTNVGDLIAAANFLRSEYQAPSLLIGHSLGGTAALSAAHQIPECKGVITIGAPANAVHVAKHFGEKISAIETEGQAEINVAGRKYTIKKQFLDNLNEHSVDHIADLHIPLLVMHSPIDQIVPIKEAEKIYRVAKHPKSFISLDNADHILSSSTDAEYVATSIAAWASKYLNEADQIKQTQANVNHGEILVQERNNQLTRNVFSDNHFWLADEPIELGGENLGPDPYEHLLAALGTCTSITLRLYANHKHWPLDDVIVELSHHRQHGKEHPQIELIERKITLKGNLSEEQKLRLLAIADRCPVHKTLQNNLVIKTTSD